MSKFNSKSRRLQGAGSRKRRFKRKSNSVMIRGYLGKKERFSKVTQTPPSKNVALIYTDDNSFTSSIGIEQRLYRLNSCHDPDITGTGKQPTGWDEWTALYSRYMVYGTKVEVEFTNATTEPVYVGIAPIGNNQTSFANVNRLSNLPKARVISLGGINGKPSGKVSFYVNHQYFQGLHDMINGSFSANVTGNPLIESNLVVFCATQDGSSSQLDCTFKVKLTMYTQLASRKILPES